MIWINKVKRHTAKLSSTTVKIFLQHFMTNNQVLGKRTCMTTIKVQTCKCADQCLFQKGNGHIAITFFSTLGGIPLMPCRAGVKHR